MNVHVQLYIDRNTFLFSLYTYSISPLPLTSLQAAWWGYRNILYVFNFVLLYCMSYQICVFNVVSISKISSALHSPNIMFPNFLGSRHSIFNQIKTWKIQNSQVSIPDFATLEGRLDNRFHYIKLMTIINSREPLGN